MKLIHNFYRIFSEEAEANTNFLGAKIRSRVSKATSNVQENAKFPGMRNF